MQQPQQTHNNIDEYLKELEAQNDDLRSAVEKYSALIGASYRIYIVDDTMDRIDFLKIMDYYCTHGWVLHPKRQVADDKRRWEYFSLTEQSLQLVNNSRHDAKFAFPYKSKAKTLLKKYGPETIEAINKFNIMLNTQSVLENRTVLEIYDGWVKNFSY